MIVKKKTSHQTAKEKGMVPCQCYDRPEIRDEMQAHADAEGTTLAAIMRRAFRVFLYGPTGRKPDEK